jgi:hypothetical protein
MSTAPTQARKRLINQTVVSLKSSGIWSLLDILYVIAAETAQAGRINWKNPGTFDALAVNSPTFVTDRGYTGDGSTSRLRTQFVPSVNGVNYKLNDASCWIWCLTEAAANPSDIGSVGSGGNIDVLTRNAGGTLVGYCNDGTGTNTSVASSVGLSGVSRVSSTVKRLWRNGVQQGSDASVASTSLTSLEQWICGANSSQFSAKQIAFAAWGASLTGKEAALYSAVRPYMQAIGAA